VEVGFRPAGVDDLGDLHEIWWATQPDEQGRDNPWWSHVLVTGSILVAVVDTQVVAFAGLRHLGSTAVISDCFVRPDLQGQRIGTGMLERLVARDRPVMTLASDDPKALSLYRRFGMNPVAMCHYVAVDPRRFRETLPIREMAEFPIPVHDIPHLADHLHCTFLAIGEASSAAVTSDSIETSVVGQTDDPAQVIGSVLAWMSARGSTKVEIQISDAHGAYQSLTESGFVVKYSDTLMASLGANVPYYWRVTFNGDLLAVLA
jgi:GNAT superfamily N-acetyltransferase